MGGARIDLSGNVTGDVSIGYISQNYDAATLETISGPTLGAALTWNVTALTTLKGSISRSILETTTTGASGYLSSSAGITIDHELRRNMLIGGNVDASDQKYRGNGQKDREYKLGAYFKYLMNRQFYLTGEYDFTRKNSSVGGSGYSQNVALLKLTAQY